MAATAPAATPASAAEGLALNPGLTKAGEVLLAGLLTLTIAACSPGGDATGSSGPSSAPAASLTATDMAGPGTSATPDEAAIEAARAALRATLDTMADGYTFTTTVMVADQVVTRADGRSTGGASQFNVTAKGVRVTYRTIPPKAWIRKANGAWQQLDGGAPAMDLVSALRTPANVALVPDAAGPTVFTASYDAASLGAGASGDVAVTLTLGADGTLTIAYSAVVDQATGTTGTTTTTLSPAPGQEAITAP